MIARMDQAVHALERVLLLGEASEERNEMVDIKRRLRPIACFVLMINTDRVTPASIGSLRAALSVLNYLVIASCPARKRACWVLFK
ncbi:hypothetical protein M378DRAFT_333701 [Amanita muscaria Koide BX008]|nr:hypothetical protein M378DRAFT_333701 [Amanita muscaria Koide BX008]